MTRVFFVTSPLHLLIALLLAVKFEKSQNILLLAGAYTQRNAFFMKHMKAWEETPFARVLQVVKSTKVRNYHALNIQAPVQEVIVGNDKLPGFHALCASKLVDSSTQLSYMDDGLFSYVEYTLPLPTVCKHFLSNLYRKIVKGYMKPFPHTVGASPLTQSCYLFYPEKRKPALLNKQAIPILEHQSQLDVARLYAQRCLDDVENMGLLSAGEYTLVILPHHKNMDALRMQDFIAEVSAIEGLVVLKNHPSNDNQFVEELFDHPPFLTVPKHIPIEFLVMACPPRTIYTGFSSIALTAKLFSLDVAIKPISWPEGAVDTMQSIIASR